MPQATDISIIIPVYNVEAYVGKCLQSVINQNGLDQIKVECIIVDDCGQDRSMQIVRDVAECYNRNITFNLITHSHNQGLSAARNTGIRYASGNYLYFLDSDDWISPSCMLELWAQVRLHPDVDIVFGRAISTPDADTWEHLLNLKSRGAYEFCDNISTLRSHYLRLPEIAWGRLIRRDFIIDNNLFFKEGLIHEDTHWRLKSYSKIKSYAALIASEPSYFYLTRPGSIMNTNSRATKYKRMHLVYLDLADKLDLWDRNVMRIYAETLLMYRKTDEDFCRKAFKELLPAVLSNPHLSRLQRTGLRILKLPKQLIIGRVFLSLVNRISPSL